jgi:hypothetical protein
MTASDPKLPSDPSILLLRSMQCRDLPKIVPFLALLTALLSGCEVKNLYAVRLSDLREANTEQEFRRDHFRLFAAPALGPEVVTLTLIASAEPPPERDWTWGEFGSWPQARRDAAFSDWFDRTYLEVSVSGGPECPLKIQKFDHRASAQQALHANWMSDIKPVGRFPGGSKGISIGFPVEQCLDAADSEDTDYAWIVADVRDSHGELLDTVRIAYRIELHDSFVDSRLF